MTESTFMADTQLARALTALEQCEQEKKELQRQLHELEAMLKEQTKRTSKLETTKEELMHVNNQWDIEYREQEEAFRRYRYDSQQAQTENHALIAKLKREKEESAEEIKTLNFELQRLNRELESYRQRLATVEPQQGRGAAPSYVGGRGSGGVGVSLQRVAALEEEIALLRQQLKTYQEDFEAERRDRERMSEEKQSASLRYEAEITSLRLQLDRCRNELAHYTTEATRLSQQLRLKNQYEEEQYKKHLESRGYVPRSPNGTLPPLDPYVEIDQHDHPPYIANGSTNRVRDASACNGELPRLHQYTSQANSVENVQQDSGHRTASSLYRGTSRSMRQERLIPGGLLHRGVEPQREYTRSAPELKQPASQKYPPLSNRRSVTPSPSPPPLSPSHLYPITNGYHSDAQTSGAMTNGHRPTFAVNKSHLSATNIMKYSSSNPDVVQIPPMETQGKFCCPRCARRFVEKSEFSDHKIRCIN